MKRLRFICEAVACRFVLTISGLLPRRLLLAFGGLTGRLAYLFDSRHRKITLENLQSALGAELDRKELKTIARRCWRNVGRNVFEAFCFSRHGLHSIGKIVHYEGLEHIQDAYASGRGVLLFSAHFGHWELTALMQGYLGMPLTLVTRPIDNPIIERIFADLRGRSGNRIVHKRSAVREILRALSTKGGVAIVIDQDARDNGIFVPFFDRPASTTPTLALVALRTGAAVIPTFSVPADDGSYRTVYLPALEIEPSGNRDEDIQELTRRATEIIEEWVRRYPEHWFWMHRRWKTTPPPATEPQN